VTGLCRCPWRRVGRYAGISLRLYPLRALYVPCCVYALLTLTLEIWRRSRRRIPSDLLAYSSLRTWVYAAWPGASDGVSNRTESRNSVLPAGVYLHEPRRVAVLIPCAAARLWEIVSTILPAWRRRRRGIALMLVFLLSLLEFRPSASMEVFYLSEPDRDWAYVLASVAVLYAWWRFTTT